MLKLWGPVAVWAAAIFASSMPDMGSHAPSAPDWITHGSAYAILGLLVSRALAGGFPLPLSWRSGALAVLLSTSYGAADEWHQSFDPLRHPSAADVVKDGVGAALGALAYARAAAQRGLSAR